MGFIELGVLQYILVALNGIHSTTFLFQDRLLSRGWVGYHLWRAVGCFPVWSLNRRILFSEVWDGIERGANTKIWSVKVQNDIHTSKHINKQTSPIFNCVTPVSVSLATLARQLLLCNVRLNSLWVNRVVFDYCLSLPQVFRCGIKDWVLRDAKPLRRSCLSCWPS